MIENLAKIIFLALPGPGKLQRELAAALIETVRRAKENEIPSP